MSARFLGHVRSQLVGYAALFVALGGTAIAAIPANSVGTAQLKNGAVTGAKVAQHTLTGANINLSRLGTVPNAARLASKPPSAFQSRVTGTCSGSQAIAKINAAGTVSCSLAPAPAWSLTGNAGTNPAHDYLGTRDNQPLNLDVNGQQALQLQPNATSPNLIGGLSVNTVTAGTEGAVIGGGGETGNPNTVNNNFGTVSGGEANTAGYFASVPGGNGNAATGFYSTASGTGNTAGANDTTALGNSNTAGGAAATAVGDSNTADGADATAIGTSNTASGLGAVALGQTNTASDEGAVALGESNTANMPRATAFGFGNTASSFEATAFGYNNIASGSDSTAVGESNTAGGTDSAALGKNAKIPTGDDNSFVWSDGTQGTGSSDFSATGTKQFDALASNGFNMQLSAPGAMTVVGCTLTTMSAGWQCTSDRNAKTAFSPISDQTILRSLSRMPIESWTYRLDRTGTRHIGPTAQAFRAAFHIGSSSRAIGTLDEGGVALAGEKGLYRLLLRQQREIQALRSELAALHRP